MVGANDAKAEGGGAAAAADAADCSLDMGLLGFEDIAFVAGVDESMIFFFLLLRQRRMGLPRGDQFKTPTPQF